MTIIFGLLGLVGLSFGLFCAFRLYRWERLLRRSRIAVAYKGKVKMNKPLIEWLRWCQAVDSDPDKKSNGQTVFIAGAVRIAVLRPIHRSHGKTVTKEVKSS